MTKFIKLEDQRHFRKKTDVPTIESKREDKRSREGGRNRRPPRRDLPAPLGPRYDRYTNLIVPRERVFEKALQTNMIFIRKRYTPRGADETKTCRFHDNRGHTTKSCQVLKDEIEQLIRVGHLQEFVKGEMSQRECSPKRREEVQNAHVERLNVLANAPEADLESEIRPKGAKLIQSQAVLPEGEPHPRPARGTCKTYEASIQ